MSSSASTPSPQERMAQRFVQFGQFECLPASPLYSRLCLGIATDPALLELATHAHARPIPNLLLAAVHYLLLQGVAHPLASFYPSLTPTPDRDHDPYPAFHEFCLAHYREIQALIATRYVQTNEVRRCAVLLPAFGLVSSYAPAQPLALIEIGPSAGLNLLWERYGYSYAGQWVGALQAPLQLSCELRGKQRPPLPTPLPSIAFRVGIDLNPVDVNDAAATLWLRALIWPEQHERAERLAQALEITRQNPPPLLKGNALEVLPALLPTLPLSAIVCLYHSFTLNQFSSEARTALSQLLADFSIQRDLYRIALEHNGQEVVLTLFTYRQGLETAQKLALSDGHATWLEWL